MTDHHDALRHAGDLAASGSGALVIASHWAELWSPIFTALIGIATLVWWGVRFYDRFVRKGKK